MEEVRNFQGFPAGLFRERRERVLEEVGSGAMVLPAAPLLVRAGDSELPYRPDSELFYVTGFGEPEAVLVLRGFASEDRSVLFLRPRDPAAERWSGPRMGPGKAPERLGVDSGRSMEELAGALPDLLEGADRVYFRLGTDPRVEPHVVQALRTARVKGAREGKGPRGVVDPGEILDELRLRKDPEEIEAIREAARITVAGIREAMQAARPGMGEWELEAVLSYAFRREGAAGSAFAPIVGSGTNACVLHYVDNSARTRSGDLVLVDAGAEVRLYAGDASRTFPVSGRFSPEQEAAYQVVDAARRRAVDGIRPDATVREVHEAAVETLLDGLLELGVLRGSRDELREKKAHKPFFPHRTSHWLGMNTHDPGDYAREGRARALEAGMTLTVEPGLYFPPEPGEEDPEEWDQDVLSGFRGMGIRIEDDVLVTGEGREVLTADLPTAPDEVEALVGRGVKDSASSSS